MLVDSVAAGLDFPTVKVVVMRSNPTMKEIAEDIHRGIFKIAGYSKVLFIVGREEVRRGFSVKTGLNKLVHALCTFGKQTHFVFCGPLPAHGDSTSLIRDLLESGIVIKRRIERLPGFTFCDASAWFADRNGICDKYIDRMGLTGEGASLLRERFHHCCPNL